MVGSTRHSFRTRAHFSTVAHAPRSPPGVRPRGERVSERGSARSRRPGLVSAPGRPPPSYREGTALRAAAATNAARNLWCRIALGTWKRSARGQSSSPARGDHPAAGRAARAGPFPPPLSQGRRRRGPRELLSVRPRAKPEPGARHLPPPHTPPSSQRTVWKAQRGCFSKVSPSCSTRSLGSTSGGAIPFMAARAAHLTPWPARAAPAATAATAHPSRRGGGTVPDTPARPLSLWPRPHPQATPPHRRAARHRPRSPAPFAVRHRAA